MVRNTATLALVLVGLMAVSGHHQSNDYWKDFAARSTFADSMNFFSFEYYLNIAKDKHDSEAFTASNEFLLFHQIALGLAGNSKDQLYKKLHYNGTDLEKTGFASLYKYYNSFSEFDFFVKNKIFYPSSVAVKQSYLEALQKYYKSEPFAVDFAKYEEAYKAINEWANKASNSHIDHFISQDNSNKFDEKTSLFLASVFYFKPKFLYPIDASSTAFKPFYKKDGTSQDVSTMLVKGSFNHGYYFEDYSAQFVEIPFAYKEYSHAVIFSIVFPADGYTFEDIEYKFNKGFNASKHQEYRNMNVYLPKFKIESSGDLKKYYSELDIFGDNADFSNFTDSKVKVTSLFQKMIFEIDETSNVQQPQVHESAKDGGAHADNSNHDIDMYVNKPFFFGIHWNGIEVCVGRYTGPK